MSIMRVFPFARDFVSFPRLLFWRLHSANRRSLPLVLPPLSRRPLASSPVFLSRCFLPVWVLRGAAASGEGCRRRNLAIVELSYLEDGARGDGVSAEIQSVMLF